MHYIAHWLCYFKVKHLSELKELGGMDNLELDQNEEQKELKNGVTKPFNRP